MQRDVDVVSSVRDGRAWDRMGWDSEDLQEVAGSVLQDAPRLATTLHGYYIANRFTPRFVLCMVAPEITSTLGRQAGSRTKP